MVADHEKFLEALRQWVYDNYDKEGGAKEFGPPMNSQFELNKYFSKGHFCKNFHTNYHALHTLFLARNGLRSLSGFYVYDIACGPYTATMSFLNFLQNERGTTDLSFVLTLCDKGDWVLKRFRNSQRGDTELIFPVPLALLVNLPPVVKNYMGKQFSVKQRKICLNSCKHKTGHYNRSECTESLSCSMLDTESAANLLFLSYPSVGPHINEGKFVLCIERLIKSFSGRQKMLPTYIIYSHYIPEESDWRTEKEKTTAAIATLSNPNFHLLDTDRNQEVPFPKYYYCIFEEEVDDAAA